MLSHLTRLIVMINQKSPLDTFRVEIRDWCHYDQLRDNGGYKALNRVSPAGSITFSCKVCGFSCYENVYRTSSVGDILYRG